MAKKEFPGKEDNAIFNKLNLEAPADSGEVSSPKPAFLYQNAFGILKLLMGVCLLPFVFSVTAAFLNELSGIEAVFQSYLWAGVSSFIVIYLFIYEPAIVYSKGHRLLEMVFQFLKPLVKVAPYLLPIYTILLFIIYLLASFALSEEGTGYFTFLLSFSLVLHLVYSAKTLRSKKGDFLKANYIFGFSFVYILNVMLFAFCLNIMFKNFSYVNFFNNFFQTGSGIIRAAFRQLFSC
ncbi:MAG: hypothetical protein PHE18_01835 [Candidatus Omnitrophica bacterium]|nr:hypothetical protein [Candidatus Omnitrophota bacterium]MDD5552594.1 hypothetical protein [Candidatus Omnitrophota bacterium]